MEPMVEEKCEVKVLAISNTQTVIADKNKITKESEATNAEKKVKFYIIYVIYVAFTFLHILFLFF